MTNIIEYMGNKYKINDNVQSPNFFIIGAPKCGTTSLSEYLREHPDIFFAYPKETNFFNTDFSPKYRKYQKLDRYLNECFYDSKGYKAVGEGTVFYLMSDVAIDNILKFNPEAKFIVMIRNPIELSYSMHSTELYGGNENAENFNDAWNLQEDRKNNKSLPPLCREPKILQYGTLAKTGKQLQRLLKKIPQEKLKIILFDDFKKDVKTVYDETIEFLGLIKDNRTKFPIANENRESKIRFVTLLISYVGRKLKIITIKKKLGITPGKSLLKIFEKWNAKSVKRNPLPDSFKKELQKYFENDVHLLQMIINRDLSHWLK